MIDPENELPIDDAPDADAADQLSQQDIHSNGFDDNVDLATPEEQSAHDADQLQQASDASEASFTLDVDRGIAPGPNDDKTGN